MSAVMIRCPSTGQAVSTQIETEPAIFARLPKVDGRMRCELCGADHVWTTGDAWLAEETTGPAAARR